MQRTFSLSMLLCFFLANFSFNFHSSAAEGIKLNEEQKNELYSKGKITDVSGTVWNIHAIPGLDNICKWSKDGFTDCQKAFANLVDAKFWKGVYEDTCSPLKFSGDCIWKWGIKGSIEQCKETYEKNNQLDDSAMGSSTYKALKWCEFGLTTCARAVIMPLGVVAGLVGAIIVPTFEIAWQPVKGTYNGLARGMIYPSAAWLWHNGAYVFNKGGNVPSSEAWMLVSMEKKGEGKFGLNLDSKTFSVMVRKLVLDEATASLIKEKKAEITVCEEKIGVLREECKKEVDEFYSEPVRKEALEDKTAENLYYKIGYQTVLTADHKIVEVINKDDLMKSLIEQIRKDEKIPDSILIDFDTISKKVMEEFESYKKKADQFVVADEGKVLEATPNPIPLPIHASTIPHFDPVKKALEGI